jgi:hypothetical protein
MAESARKTLRRSGVNSQWLRTANSTADHDAHDGGAAVLWGEMRYDALNLIGRTLSHGLHTAVPAHCIQCSVH